MRKPARATLTAAMVGALMFAGVAVAPAASAAPRQMPSTGLLAPQISFSFGGAGTISQFGAAAGVYVSYKCSPTLDSPLLPHLLGSSSSLTLQISEDIAHHGTQTITAGSRTITDLACDNTTHKIIMDAVTYDGLLPFVPGDAGVGLMVMKVCDLLGCSTASSVGAIDLSS